MLIAIESFLTVTAVVLALITPKLGASWFERCERRFARLARRRRLAVVSAGLLALALRAALLPILPIPEPAIHDEFSYLLAADTFVHGRLANPTHPMWVHFETFHVNQKPTYGSKYFPAPALFLAAGQVIFGHPFWGVWLSIGLMCAAVCWALQGWLPLEWALLGASLAVIRLGTFSYWANSYLGGSVAAIGGALVLGALPRIEQSERVGDALLMGVGLAILATSRPFEGLFLSLPLVIALALWILGKESPPLSTSFRKIVLPLGFVVALSAGAMLYYFWRTTGSPLLSPYAVSERNDPIPLFPWQPLKSVPESPHQMMQKFFGGAILEQYHLAREHPFILATMKAMFFWLFFLGPILTLPVALLLFTLPYGFSYKDLSPGARLLLVACCASSAALLLPIYFSPHYAAPVTAAIYALILLTLRQLRPWEWRGKPTGLFLSRAVPSVCVILLLLRITTSAFQITLSRPYWPNWCSPSIELADRARLQSRLDRSAGLHLLVVRYGAQHDPDREWVYNAADIDHAKIVWARDMGTEKNRELLEYFKDRWVWLVEPDENPTRVSPYSDVPIRVRSETAGVSGKRAGSD